MSTAEPPEGVPAHPDQPEGRRPNLFIVGAPKSGTTALWTYLRNHPQIYTAGGEDRASGLPAAGGKEFQFFGSDLPSNIPVHRSLEAYLGAFAAATDERYLVDASPMYLCSERAAAEIAAFAPDARAVAMLRNPVDMMYSLHAEALFQGDEDIADFAEALAAEEDRRQGRRIPPTCQGALWSLLYRNVAGYADQVQRFMDALGPERVHVIVFDDFAADPDAVYRELLAFLGLDVVEEEVPDFAVRNAHKAPRSRLAVRLLRNPPPVLRRVARTVVRSQATRRALGLRALELNADRRPRPSLDPALRRALQAEMADDVRRLGALLDRDLSGWLTSGDESGPMDGRQAGGTEGHGRQAGGTEGHGRQAGGTEGHGRQAGEVDGHGPRVDGNEWDGS